MREKRWELYPPISTQSTQALEELHEYGPIVAQVLFNRGIEARSDAERFFDPQLTDLHDPFLLKDMEKAVERIKQVVNRNELIAIYGDYDADGVCSIVILLQALRAIGARVMYYVPDRAEEGYGMNIEAVKQLIAQKVNLIVTVDCGISNIAEIECANQADIDVIVTDHHHVPERLPPAYAIINPKQTDCEYPFKNLAGAGVAYKLAEALRQSFGVSCTYDPLDLTAMATVADVVPLIGENRVIVANGLKLIKQAKRPGIAALIEASGYEKGEIDSYHLGFHLGPRLNAAGRLTSAKEAISLLDTSDRREADKQAASLTDLNSRRQFMTQKILNQAREQIRGKEDDLIYILSGENWPAGIVGLVAGKICEEFYRPVLVLEQGETISRGSARSISGLHITQSLSECESLLLRYGGHALAAGFELENTNFDEFRTSLVEVIEKNLDPENLIPVLRADVELDLDQVSYDLYNVLRRFEPFGYGNPRPLFIGCRQILQQANLVGKTRNHLRVTLRNSASVYSGIGFGLGSKFPSLTKGANVDTLFSIDENEWQGVKSLQLKIKDIKSS